MKREINVMDYEKDFLEETAPTYVNKEVWKPKTAKEADWCLGKIREKEAETAFVEKTGYPETL